MQADTPQQDRLENARILIYSHDTFGLGHLRRCRTLAHALVEQFQGLSVLIISGSPIIGRFEFKSRVDFVRIPGVIKLRNGDYTSLGLHIDLKDTLKLREAIILHTATAFQPDLFIVDKEPLGLKGEIETTLQMLLDKGVPSVLGIRDVLDSPRLLKPEWESKQAISAIERYYREIWVYGDAAMGNPLAGLDIPEKVQEKIHYSGYLQRHLPETAASQHLQQIPGPYILITPGGGGDGVEMVEAVLSAYEQCQDLPWHVLFVLGPFMAQVEQQAFQQRVDRLANASMLTFDNQMESLMNGAAAVVAMGGYNTFCEILSFNKRALLIPRVRPREEQLIRARHAQSLGLVSVLEPQDICNESMCQALRALPEQPLPQQLMNEDFLNGLASVGQRTQQLLLNTCLLNPEA
ncbi:MAG: putative glycosyltransferase [Motiliproteus sp.]|jgi:predicted glycosyltransferase